MHRHTHDTQWEYLRFTRFSAMIICRPERQRQRQTWWMRKNTKRNRRSFSIFVVIQLIYRNNERTNVYFDWFKLHLMFVFVFRSTDDAGQEVNVLSIGSICVVVVICAWPCVWLWIERNCIFICVVHSFVNECSNVAGTIYTISNEIICSTIHAAHIASESNCVRWVFTVFFVFIFVLWVVCVCVHTSQPSSAFIYWHLNGRVRRSRECARGREWNMNIFRRISFIDVILLLVSRFCFSLRRRRMNHLT